MMTIAIVFMILFVLTFAALCFVVYKFVMQGIFVLKIEEAIEDSLIILDTSYYNIDNVLKTPLFYDSLEVKKVQHNIEDARDGVLEVAKLMTVDYDE